MSPETTSRREWTVRTLTSMDIVLCLVPVGLFMSIVTFV